MKTSETITKISAALLAFSKKMISVKKDSVNPHFRNKYASLSAIIETTQKPLSECGLVIIQTPTGENELTTRLLHESGEYFEDTYTMRPQKNDPQGLGSAITYQRRYAYGAIINLNIDEDDDGNEGSKRPKKPETKPELKESTEQFKKVVEFLIKDGEWEKVEKKYAVTPEVKESAMNAVKAKKNA